MITIGYKHNPSMPGHKDIWISIPAINLYQTADLYYFVLDKAHKSGDESVEKGIDCLCILLENWTGWISNLLLGEALFLPFDFSDEYIGGFYATLTNEGSIAMISGCSTEIAGWSISPTSADKIKVRTLPLRLDGNAVILKKEDLINDIRRSIIDIQATTPTAPNFQIGA